MCLDFKHHIILINTQIFAIYYGCEVNGGEYEKFDIKVDGRNVKIRERPSDDNVSYLECQNRYKTTFSIHK